MHWRLAIILAIQAALVLGLAVGIATGRMPLGIRGEWEWPRLPAGVGPLGGTLALAITCIGVYGGFVALGARRLAVPASRGVESLWLAALFASSISVQLAVLYGAPYGYGLTRWAYVNYLPASTGYFRIARDRAAADPWRFLREYPEWIRGQDSLHIGTHPPGLIVAQCILLRAMEGNPSLASRLNAAMPETVRVAFRSLPPTDGHPVRLAERASLYATALLTLLACAGTVIPLYLLARQALPARVAWSAAALWPLASAPNLFQPGADTTYPFLSSAAWALAAWSVRRLHLRGRGSAGAWITAAASGLVMAFGMVFTLAFLPVGLIVALFVLGERDLKWRDRLSLIAAVGVGFLAFILAGWIATRANPFVVWSWNLHHHARFYDEYPRTYSLWLGANMIELAIAIGLPPVVWFVIGLLKPREVPRIVGISLLVLLLVNLTGRNMGEVARLWMLYIPPFLIAAAVGLERFPPRPIALAATTALIGAQTLALQSLIQVVYPAV